MNILFLLFYGSFLGIVGMLSFRLWVTKAGGDLATVASGVDVELSSVGASIVHRLSILRKVFMSKFKGVVLVLIRNILDRIIAAYKKIGVALLRARDRMSKLGREKKLNGSSNVSSYIQDVLEHKENLRNGQ